MVFSGEKEGGAMTAQNAHGVGTGYFFFGTNGWVLDKPPSTAKAWPLT